MDKKVGIFMALGAGLGVLFGGFGIALGAGVGLAIGVALQKKGSDNDDKS